MDKVTRQCPQTTTFLKRKESRSGIEPRSCEKGHFGCLYTLETLASDELRLVTVGCWSVEDRCFAAWDAGHLPSMRGVLDAGRPSVEAIHPLTALAIRLRHVNDVWGL